MIRKNVFLLACMLMSAVTVGAQRHFTMNVWAQKQPHSTTDPADTAKIHVFLPDEKMADGRAIVVCPGGGYASLAMSHEGLDWAPWLNNQGIAVVVLKYRMPHGEKDAPISDAEEAVRIVRRNARGWHIDASKVGIMGFSAGGHLASTIATHAQGEAKPNFQVLFYPVITMDPQFTHHGSHDNLLGKNARKKDERDYSNDLQVTRVTPKAFIALSDDDDIVMPANGVNYYLELYRHDVPASLHVYPTGGHGYGIGSKFRFHEEMLLDLRSWLDTLR